MTQGKSQFALALFGLSRMQLTLRTRQSLRFMILWPVALFVAWSANAWAAEGLDIEYAEMQPLAADSVLLDVARVGERVVAVGERGHIVFSDNGTDWIQAEHVPTRSTLTAVFAVGDRLWAGGHDAVIITSGDRGNTWSRQFFDPERQQAVMDILFTDEDHGVAIGSYGLVLRTEDGGKTWIDELVDPENDYHLNSMVRFDDGRRMIAGEAGYSYRSFDDGASWEPLELPYLGSMWGAVKTPGDCVFFFGLRGHAMESCDFGTSWEEIDTGTQLSLAGGIFVDDRLILVGNSGAVVVREDGEISAQLHSDGVDFAAIIPVDDGHFLLVGEEGFHHYPETVAEESGQ